MGNELTTEEYEGASPQCSEASPAASALCAFCTTLNFPSIFYTSDELSRDWNRPLSAILRSSKQCSFCLLIIRCITNTPDNAGNPLHWLAARQDDDTAVFCIFSKKKIGTIAGDYGHEQHGIWITVHEKGKSRPGPGFGVGFNCGIQVLGGSIGEGADGWGRPIFTGRVIDERQTEYALVKKWMAHCPATHTGRCEPSPKAGLTEGALQTKLRLIDVSRCCIVTAPSDVFRYFALSYVWGKVKSLQLKKVNYNFLTRPGALSDGVVDLPVTIADAIYLVQNLGESYLWVDSLCIIQDSDEDKATQIANMDAVYQNAFLTIVAAAGKDANAGLPGVRPNSRMTPQIVQKVGNWSFCNMRRYFHWTVPDSVWSTRGWTFQEKLLSPRRLIFSDVQTYFECDSGTWCEDIVFEPLDAKTHKVQEFGAWMKSFPIDASASPFSRYAKLVNEYTLRNLSFEKDIIDAFAGILNMLQPAFDNTDYIFGLPENAFHSALLWEFQPLVPIVRRNHSAVPSEERMMELKFPSWSWVGWQLQVEYNSPNTEIIEEHTVALASIYRWKISGSPEQQAQKSLRLVGERAEDDTLEDREKLEQAILSFPQGPTFLYFFTSVASFPIDPEPWNPKWKSDPNIYRFRSHSGEEAGELGLSVDWHGLHQKAECILLSRDVSGPENTEVFFNVLVVEWECDIAYRVTQAKVSQKHWDEAGPVRKFLCLG